MASKQQCLKALKKVHPKATLEDNSGARYYDVVIYAPYEMNFLDAHSVVITLIDTGEKALLWDEVLKEIKKLELPNKCTPDSCCSWINDRCDVWAID